MARLNIEDHAFGDPRLAKFTREIRKANYDIDDLLHFAALGILATVWHESQAERLQHVKVETLESWTLDGVGILLLRSGYLKKEEAGMHVVGNEHQIAALESYRVRGRIGAKKRWETLFTDNEDKMQIQQTTKKDSSAIVQPSSAIAEVSWTIANDSQVQVQDQDQDQIQIQEKRQRARARPRETLPMECHGEGEDIVTPREKVGELLEKAKARKAAIDPQDRELAVAWIAWAHETSPHLKINVENSAIEIKKAREHIGRSHEQMRNIFDWIRQDNFWSNKSISPCGLMNKSQKNSLPRIDNILSSIASDKKYAMNKQCDDWLQADGLKPAF